MGEGGEVVVGAVYSLSGAYDQLPRVEQFEGMLGILLVGGRVRVSFPWGDMGSGRCKSVQLSVVGRVISLASKVPSLCAYGIGHCGELAQGWSTITWSSSGYVDGLRLSVRTPL